MEHIAQHPPGPPFCGDVPSTPAPLAAEPQPSTEHTPALAETDPSPWLDFEPVQVVRRHDGWYPERQRAFIEELAECGVVREAAGRVGMTERSARRLRLRPDAEAFSLAWDAAVRAGMDRLRSIAYDRAVNGTVRPRFYKGEQIGEERVFDNRLLLYLLGRAEHPRRDTKPEQRLKRWDEWLNAVEDGLPAPMLAPNESDRSPVWRHHDGTWLTTFRPPEGFAGEHVGTLGNDDYIRELSPAELEAIHAWTERAGEREQEHRRAAYFRRLAEGPHPR